jgi:hypothetical protein
MKKIAYILLFTFLVISLYNCGEDNTPVATTTVATTTVATTTQITTALASGTGSLPPGVNGSIQNTRVALYISVDDWNFDRTFAFTACDANGLYTISNLTPGVYYMDAWKDNDNDRVWGSSGDYVWINGSGVYPNYTLAPLQFPVGQTTTVNFQIFLVP